MLVLKCGQDVRTFVGMCAGDQQAWRKLQKFYKGVVVTAPSKKGKIAELVLEGGMYEFLKDNATITVAVRRTISFGMR